MNKELRSLLFEMKKNNLTAEAKKIEQIIGKKKEYYEDIVFFQNENDFADFEGGREGFFSADKDDQVDYLADREYGAGELFDHTPWKTSDNVSKTVVGGIIHYLISNHHLGYARLIKLIPEEEYSEYDITPEED